MTDNKLKKATFAGGCFWCMEAVFDEMEGVESVTSGYTGGDVENPSYEEVKKGDTGHYEAVHIKYDPSVISYGELLDIYWHNIDPTDPEGQFVDKGPQYRTAIFYHNLKQKEIAEKSKRELEESGVFDKPVVTEIKEFDKFYEAEDYHQDYYKKCPLRFERFESASGRRKFKAKIWKDK